MSKPKFKIGDRVKWVHFGRDHAGTVSHRDATWPIYYVAEVSSAWQCESYLSLDVPEPKQFATKLEAELGAEIIKLHYDAADLDARLTKEIGERHRERIAKESAQKELAEVRPALVRERAILADIYNAMLKQYI